MEKTERKRDFLDFLLDLIIKGLLIVLLWTAALAINTYVTRDVGRYVMVGSGSVLDTSTGIIKPAIFDNGE